MNYLLAITLLILIFCYNSCCIKIQVTQPDGTFDGFQFGELLGDGYRCHISIIDNKITLYFVDTKGNSYTIYDVHISYTRLKKLIMLYN